MEIGEIRQAFLDRMIAERGMWPANDTPLRTLDKDGTAHFSHLKKLAKSGQQYLQAVNSESTPTSDMLVGTVTHFLLFGARPTSKPLAIYRGGIRRGAKWDEFLAENVGAEIVSESEWFAGEQMAEAVYRSPIARERLNGARCEVPLTWEESGIPCSTSGVDILSMGDDLGDLKSTSTTHPETFQRHAFRMMYPQQLAWYRRGARANGIAVRDVFVLGVERCAPFEVVELTLSEEMLAFADKSLTLLIEKLRGYRLSMPAPANVHEWPGYSEAPIIWGLPAWERDSDFDEEAA